ncbi:fas-binding factor 1 homolog isoform X2 [Trichomycterus rosablanca]|uniref:fas-binding factor 1 homolog isoform X2 n=1 Tax=Trichomycterus rosablanca TaxID=2290929 RepID=UPI002F360249
MTSKKKKGLRGSVDDVLGDLLGDDSDELPIKPRSSAGGLGRPAGLLRTQSGKRNLLDDDFFNKLVEEVQKDEEDSEVSEADPKALLESMKDIDGMDADLFGSKRNPGSAPPQRTTTRNEGSKQEVTTLGDQTKPNPALNVAEPEERKTSSAPAAPVRNYKKFSFLDDVDDNLDDLLDDLDPERTKSGPSGKTVKQNSASPVRKKNEQQVIPAEPAPKKREELMFDDDEDDLMDTLGFNDTPKSRGSRLTPKKESETPQRARTRLDEILGIGTAPRLLERPVTGEKKDATQPERETDKPAQKNSAGKDTKDPMFGDEDFTFGSYQPTVASTPEGRTSRRQSVRFSTEDVSSSSPERKPKLNTSSSATSTIITSTRPSRPASDWLGLNQDDDDEEDNRQKKETAPQSLKPPPSHGGEKASRATPKSAEELRAVPSSPETSRTTAEIRKKEEEESKEEEGDWLAGALNKKKVQAEVRERRQEESLGLGEEIDLDMFLSKRNTTPVTRRRQEDPPGPPRQPSSESLVVSGKPQSPPLAPNSSTEAPQAHEFQQNPIGVRAAPAQQVSLSTDGLQQLLLQQQLAQAQLWGLGAQLDPGSVQKQRDAAPPSGDVTALQVKIMQLEGQVRSLQLEKDQLQMLLDSVQQRHKQDTELMESAHRSRVKLLEECAAQRETRARMESQELSERLEAAMALMQKERAELQEQYQRRLAQCQQERDREVERLRELQRKSILEMKKDHEEQVHRLRRLKDEEIDAVTSATSQTRSLTVIIEQMEQFSHRLGDLSSRIESTHESTTQGLELGARQRDEQLRVLQERLTQQQRDMAEERSRLKEVIARMDTQLAEQQRQLQQERWRATGEQAKAESALRGLEEERRTMTQHFTLEREELDRAKNSLLEEQQSVMQRCAEERRKLAAEWSHFHAQDKLRKERDVDREGHIFSIAQEQADLKLKAAELKQREDAAQKERENLEKLRDDLQREKERLSASALRLKNRAQEVENLSQLACERYEEGERAVQEARQVEVGHQTRLRTIHTEMDRLRKQEHSLQQERMRMTDHRREVERMRSGLPINPVPPPVDPLLTQSLGFSPVFSSTAVLPPPPVSSAISPKLQATIALLRHTAEKDRDFLEDEQFFLDTLKKAPYESTLHT